MKSLIAILSALLLASPVWAEDGGAASTTPVESTPTTTTPTTGSGGSTTGMPSGFAVIESRARAGDAEAQLEVGILYEFGFYMQNNKVPALAWYMLSAAQGNPQAIERRDMLKKELTPAQIAEAEQMSQTLKSGGTIDTMPKTENKDKKPEPKDGTKMEKKSAS